MSERTLPYHGIASVDLSLCGGGLTPRIEREEEMDVEGNYRTRARIIKLLGQPVEGEWSKWYSGEGAGHDCIINIWECKNRCLVPEACALLAGGW